MQDVQHRSSVELGIPDQRAINRAVYESRGVYRYYLSPLLTAPEIGCLLKYQPYIADKDVLDVGVGAGRTTRYLAQLARTYEAVDYSSVMVSYVKTNMPEISVREADFRDLNVFGDCSFDFIFATSNMLDALSHQDRLQALRESYRLLRPNGLLAFSSHNLNHQRALLGPQLEWSISPRFAVEFIRYIYSCWNHLRVGPSRRINPDYALLNDPGHYYACLHYYASRATVTRQLANAGLSLLEVFDTLGQVIPDGKDDSKHSSLFYVAQRLPRPGN